MAQRAKEMCSNFSIVKAFAFYVQFLTCRVIGKKNMVSTGIIALSWITVASLQSILFV